MPHHVRIQEIALAPHRADELGAGRHIAQLVAQARDRQVHRAAIAANKPWRAIFADTQEAASLLLTDLAGTFRVMLDVKLFERGSAEISVTPLGEQITVSTLQPRGPDHETFYSATWAQPIGTDGVLLLAGWSPRCFSRSDEAWLAGWGQKLRTALEQLDEPVAPASSVSAA